MTKKLWEILVPTIRPNGKPIKTKFHRVWDAKVRTISGGMTVLKPTTTGSWTNPDGEVFVERTIPVRIICTEAEINLIIQMTMDYYEQEAVLAYEISSNVKLVHRNDIA